MIPLAFTPLIDPLPALYPIMSDYWMWLVVPLVLAISIVYKGTRIKNLRQLPVQALIMSVETLILMAVAAALLGGLYWTWIRIL